jgi:hypothetical protein
LISDTTKQIVRDRSAGICEVCQAAPATNFHHRRARGMGGTRRPIHGPDWVLHLCGSGTTGCHGYIETHPEVSYARGWKLRGTRDPSIAPVQLCGQWYILLPDGTMEPHRWSPRG